MYTLDIHTRSIDSVLDEEMELEMWFVFMIQTSKNILHIFILHSDHCS